MAGCCEHRNEPKEDSQEGLCSIILLETKTHKTQFGRRKAAKLIGDISYALHCEGTEDIRT